MILGAGLDRTGALNRLAAWLLRRAHGVEQRLLLLTTAVAGLNSSFMQNPSVMALYLPVASRLSSRTGLSLSRLLLPIAAAIVMGGALTMVGNSPLILLNDLLVAANANLPSGVGDARAAAHVRAAADRPGAARRRPAVFPASSATSCCARTTSPTRA